MSAMIEPTALPSARPGAPCSAANTLTDASGSVVPMLTMVAPISMVGTPQRIDSATAWSTSRSAPLTSTRIDPAMIANRAGSGSC